MTWSLAPAVASVFGWPIIESDVVLVGEALMTSDPRGLIVGTRPHTPLEEAAVVGKRIARHGLADWVRYIGDSVGPAPDAAMPTKVTSSLLRAAHA